ncbi:MAG: hypothetical protein CM1200mP20_02770 [Pseudomonadota bacterium]|nr:MAG: hypothetical protein CM1200mP20_02770 [Pseudomonadota bacterium]
MTRPPDVVRETYAAMRVEALAKFKAPETPG